MGFKLDVGLDMAKDLFGKDFVADIFGKEFAQELEELGLRGFGMASKPHKKTLALIGAARQVLEEYHPMTLRQVYYQLVSRQVISNNKSQYQRLSRALVTARQLSMIPWEWIEDRTRQPRHVDMWDGLADFIETVRHSYRRDVWPDQPEYIEVWLEKDALSGIFSKITEEYGITLVVGRGYNSWSAFHAAASRFSQIEKPIVILYFGDFDPSGEDIVRAINESLLFFGTSPKLEKVALTRNDISEYNLPPDFTKASDTRQASFVEKYGDIAVELDALPLRVLEEKIRRSIESHVDMDSFNKVVEVEKQELNELGNLLQGRGKA